MTLHQNVTVAVNPLYLDSPEANELRTFFAMLGINPANITLNPATPESGADDPSAAFTVTYQVNSNVLEGSRYGYARQFVMSCDESTLSHFKRRFKATRDGFFGESYRNIAKGLVEDLTANAAGTFVMPSALFGYSFDDYVKAVLQGAIDTYPSIDV